MNKYICIHGHFYQPPRENAWLEQVELQDSAHPFHDWNERITSECYGPNAASRILNGDGVIENIVNNYAKISFNFGPTLLSWMEIHEPETYEAILEADVLSQQYFDGHGSALAQVYNHIIMPLANEKDKETQVIWGIRDFESRFRRLPEGMWLAETAVDIDSLEILAKHGIKYTILAPRQAKSVRPLGGKEWTDVLGIKVDPRRPYLCQLPSGKSISIFFYDGHISQSVAFNNLLSNGKYFADALLKGFDTTKEAPQLVHIATDGESYGHHHRHGDMALAFCLHHIENEQEAELINYGAYLEKFPPTYEVEIVEDSSWSCVHGIGRWKEDCGCHTGGWDEWNQKWRKPLRESLDWLRDEVNVFFEAVAYDTFDDPWAARNDFIEVIMNREDEQITAFFKEHLKVGADASKALKMMEMQRNMLLMYTSCAWFFDEVSGIETTQVMQYACRAIQLMEEVQDKKYESKFLKRLVEAPSNLEEHQNAAVIYEKYVQPTRLDLKRVGMHYAVASIFERYPEALPIFNYETENEYFEKKIGGNETLVVGVTKIKSIATLSESKFSFAALHLGQQSIIGNISMNMDRDSFDEMKGMLIAAFEESRIGDIIGIMQTYFGPDKYTLWHLFKDEKRRVLRRIMEKSMFQVENSFRRIYNRDYHLVNTLKNDHIPIPVAYMTTLAFVLNADLKRSLIKGKIDLTELQRIIDEFSKWNLQIDDGLSLSKHASRAIYQYLLKIGDEIDILEYYTTLNGFFDLLKKVDVKPDLHKSQNLYFELSKNIERLGETVDAEKIPDFVKDEEWMSSFKKLGQHLGIKIKTPVFIGSLSS